jgi:hypothetical protein
MEFKCPVSRITGHIKYYLSGFRVNQTLASILPLEYKCLPWTLPRRIGYLGYDFYRYSSPPISALPVLFLPDHLPYPAGGSCGRIID